MSIESNSKSIVSLDAIDLLTPERFDIVFKYALASLMDKGIYDKWAIAPYEHHLKVWNNLIENDPPKNGIDEYISSFKQIIKSIRNGGYDPNQSPIPIDDLTSAPLNGAHRIAAAMLTNSEVPCYSVERKDQHKVGCFCSSSYLLNRSAHVPGGLSRVHADQAAHTYTKLKNTTRIITVFPSAQAHDSELAALISKECKLIYSTKLNLPPLAAFNFIRYAYDEDKSRGNPWLGNFNDKWSGASSKTRHCFSQPGPTRLYWFEEESPEQSVRLKEEIRDIFKIGKHSVHINDTYSETLSMSGYLLNENSHHFLSTAQPQPIQKFDHFFEKFRLWIKTSNLDPEDFCVDSSAVLAAYGLRDCRDLDFLYYGDSVDTGMIDVSCHNEEMKYYQHTKNDIIFNPQNHFYYKGVKFASLNVVRAMKKFRNEEKDKIDVKLMDVLL